MSSPTLPSLMPSSPGLPSWKLLSPKPSSRKPSSPKLSFITIWFECSPEVITKPQMHSLGTGIALVAPDLGSRKLSAAADEPILIDREALAQSPYTLANPFPDRVVFGVSKNLGDQGPDLLHFRLFHSAGCHGRRANPDSGRLHRRLSIERYRILVNRDSRTLQRFFCLRAGNTPDENIYQ